MIRMGRLGTAILWIGLLMVLIHCRENGSPGSPCDSPILLEDIRPGVGSLQKMPYRDGQVLILTDQSGHPVELRFGSLETKETYHEDTVPCAEDSSQTQKVRYKIQSHLLPGNASDPDPWESISLELKVLYNTLRPLANERAELLVLKVSAEKNDGDGIELISIPLLNKNYPFQLPNPDVLPSISIGPRNYNQVYTGQVSDLNGLRAYFTLDEGLIRLQDSTGRSWTRLE